MNKQETNTPSREHKSIQTEPLRNGAQREWCRITAKDAINCLSTFLVPFLFGIFTIIITLQQTKQAQQQRAEDQQAARVQREQDLNISSAQRAEDALRRLQDLNISKAQRAEDALLRLQDLNITQMQRLTDIHNAESKLNLDKHLAELQRNLSEDQRAHELIINAQRYDQEQSNRRHGLLTIYMNEIEILIGKFNGTVTADSRTATMVRGKTLSLIRELDTVRKAHLIRFLHEAGQLTNGQRPIDLTDAELDNIDLNIASSIQAMHGLALAKTYLRNASFVKRHLIDGNFSGACLTGAEFSDSFADRVDFSNTILNNTSFTNAILINASFVDSNGYGVKFDRVNATGANFSRARLEGSSFVQSALDGVSFVGANLSACNLSLTTLNGTLFMSISGRRADFSLVSGKGVQFSNASLSETNFQHAYLRTSTFFRMRAENASFASSNMYLANFTDAYCGSCNFNNSTLVLATFTIAFMTKSTFLNADLTMGRLSHLDADRCDFSNIIAPYSNFSYCKCVSTKFAHANLTGADFRRVHGLKINLTSSDTRFTIFTQSFLQQVSFVNGNVEKAVFTHAYLHSANLVHSNFDSKQLRQANAIEDAKLPSPWNSTVTREYNLIQNGQANCSVPVSKYWNVTKGVIVLGFRNLTDCYFALPTNHSAVIMSQYIDVKRYIIPAYYLGADGDRHTIILHANVGGSVIVRLVGQPMNVVRIRSDKHVENGTHIYAWSPKITKAIQVIVEFNGNNGSAWCDEIDLWIRVPEAWWYWLT